MESLLSIHTEQLALLQLLLQGAQPRRHVPQPLCRQRLATPCHHHLPEAKQLFEEMLQARPCSPCLDHSPYVEQWPVSLPAKCKASGYSHFSNGIKAVGPQAEKLIELEAAVADNVSRMQLIKYRSTTIK